MVLLAIYAGIRCINAQAISLQPTPAISIDGALQLAHSALRYAREADCLVIFVEYRSLNSRRRMSKRRSSICCTIRQAYARALTDKGVEVDLNEIKGGVHGFDLLVASSSLAKDAMQRRIQFLRRIFGS